MPPQRTIPPAKAMKTERTHEENQERSVTMAYPNAIPSNTLQGIHCRVTKE
jgi:hypothetical protein